MNKLLAILIVLGLGFACNSAKASKTKPKTKTTTSTKPKQASTTTATSVAFVESDLLSPVLEMAQKQKKPVFVEFYADWCAPCKVMEEEVFSQKPTYTYLNKNFINYKVDIESANGKKVASIYEVSALPTIVFINPQGVVLERKTGMATHTNLVSMGDSALKKSSN